jgi:hypothetical protein
MLRTLRALTQQLEPGCQGQPFDAARNHAGLLTRRNRSKLLHYPLFSPSNKLKTSKLAPTSAVADKLTSHSSSSEPSDMADAHQKVHLSPMKLLEYVIAQRTRR